MSDSNESHSPLSNRLLAALPPEDYQRLLPHFEPVTLSLGEFLYRPGEAITYAYFPMHMMISLVSVMSNNKRVEVGVVGREGMVSTAIFLEDGISPFESMAQVAGTAIKIDAGKVKEEFNRAGALHNLLLRYTQSLYLQVSQTAACNRLHSVDERLARWLLMVHDRMQTNTLELKHEFLSMMLGVERSRVTLAAITLQESELIKYRRGKVTILSRAGLEQAACECYARVHKKLAMLLSQ